MNSIAFSTENHSQFLGSLRQKTALSHKHLENNIYSKAILEEDVTIQDYQIYLAKLYGIVFSCDNDVFPAIAAIFPDVVHRHKSHLILNDLKSTGLKEAVWRHLPVHHFEVSSIAQAAGIAYVLEGSTLGGKVLYRHVNKTLELDEKEGASYFQGYGNATGTMWKAFVTNLTRYAVSQNCEEEIISSAVNSFELIDNWLTQSEIMLSRK